MNSTADTHKGQKENTLASGFVTCPECGTQVNGGTAGLANLVQHRGKGPCLGLSAGAGPYGLPVGLPMGIPAKTLTCRSRLPVAAGP
jgi:hypothetical protein